MTDIFAGSHSIDEALREGAALPALSPEDLAKIGEKYLAGLGGIITTLAATPAVGVAQLSHADVRARIAQIAVEAVADLPREVVYVTDPSRIRVAPKLVRSPFNRFVLWLGAAFGFLAGLVLLFFLTPGVINLNPGPIHQIALSTGVDQVWYWVIVLVLSTSIGTGIAALFAPRDRFEAQIFVINDDGTEVPAVTRRLPFRTTNR